MLFYQCEVRRVEIGRMVRTRRVRSSCAALCDDGSPVEDRVSLTGRSEACHPEDRESRIRWHEHEERRSACYGRAVARPDLTLGHGRRGLGLRRVEPERGYGWGARLGLRIAELDHVRVQEPPALEGLHESAGDGGRRCGRRGCRCLARVRRIEAEARCCDYYQHDGCKGEYGCGYRRSGCFCFHCE